jgi:diaminopimelate decarboxylase
MSRSEPGVEVQDVDHIEELKERLAAAEQLNAQLEHALESRIVIEQAKGVLSERLGFTVEEAFDVLRYAARSARIKLHELAALVVSERRTPNSVVVALARRARWRSALMMERDEAMREALQELTEAVDAQINRIDKD